MSIKKEYLDDGRKCRATFILPRGIGKNAQKVQIVGEFNRWSHSATPMRKLRNGNFVVILELPICHEYQFRYLVDDMIWMNDSDADRFVPTPFGDSENCVVTTYNESHIEKIKAYQLKPRTSTPNVQPLEKSFSDISSPRPFFSMLTDQLQTMTNRLTKSSLAIES